MPRSCGLDLSWTLDWRSARGVLLDQLLAGPMHRGESVANLDELVLRELGQHATEELSTSRLDLLERGSAALGKYHEDHAPIRVVSLPLHEAAFLHAADDAGRAGDGDVERLGQAAHWQGPRRAQLRQDVHVGHAHRAADQVVEALAGAVRPGRRHRL